MKLHIKACKGRLSSNVSRETYTLTPLTTVTSDVEVLSPDCIWGPWNEKDLKQIINSCYKESTKWRRNLFLLPSGSTGKQFITEMTRLISEWNKSSPMYEIALISVMIMPSLLLQKFIIIIINNLFNVGQMYK